MDSQLSDDQNSRALTPDEWATLHDLAHAASTDSSVPAEVVGDLDRVASYSGQVALDAISDDSDGIVEMPPWSFGAFVYIETQYDKGPLLFVKQEGEDVTVVDRNGRVTNINGSFVGDYLQAARSM